MYNDLFSIGPFTVHSYGLMTAIGIIAAYLLMEHLAKKKGLETERIFWLLIWCLIFGYLGSKVLYLITILPQIIADPSVLKRSLTDGWVMYGGLLGGILGGFLYCKHAKLNAWAYFDIGLPAVALAQAFGRIGCFLAGCCYGAETSGAFHIVFTHSDFAPNNVPLIPTQLIMSAGDFLLFAFLMIYDKKKKNEGEVTGAYLTLYSIGRFTVEFFRGDIARGAVGPLSTSQFIALFVFAFGLFFWIRQRRSNTGIFKPELKKEETKDTDTEGSKEDSGEVKPDIVETTEGTETLAENDGSIKTEGSAENDGSSKTEESAENNGSIKTEEFAESAIFENKDEPEETVTESK